MGTAHQASTDPDLQRYQQPHTTSTTGFAPGGPKPVRLQLQAQGIDLNRLTADLATGPGGDRSGP
jgi:hypothetical protein